MNTPSENPQSTADREIVSTRLFDATREQVFQAWTDPVILARWWGPKDFRNTFHEFDARPGGVWRFVMHGPDGTDYKNESVFREIEQPARIVFDHVSSPRFRVVATFDAEGGKTRVTFRMIFESVEALDRVKSFVPECNEQNVDRLAVQLALL